ncbi:MAG: hypothetical protein EOL87_16840 [Spartobacteria bacterium]|nr:hypothetical protein [Spartobacteria bacterium]
MHIKYIGTMVLCSAMLAHAEPADDTVFGPDSASVETESHTSVSALLDEYVANQNWTLGENRRNGEAFFVATGVGIIQASPSSPDIIDARVNAYDMGMLRAKQMLAEYLGQRVQTEATLSYAEGNIQRLDSVDYAEPTIMQKINQLLHLKLDELLEQNGKKRADVTKDELLSMARASEEYQRLTRSSAEAMVAGLQSYKVIENMPSSGQGQIGVVAIYSPKLMRMAYALASGTALEKATPKSPLSEQIPNKPEILVSSFGVSQRIDENGDFVLVSFGQAQPVTPSERSMIMAERKARLQALGFLRSFAGESVTLMSDLLAAQTSTEYENMTSSYSNDSAYREHINTRADALNIAGVETLRRWREPTTAMGVSACGVVLVWSPARHAKAQQFGAQMRQQSHEIMSRPKSGDVPPPSGYSREGLEGDPDAF